MFGGFFSVFNNNLGFFPCSFAGNNAYHLPAMQDSAISTQYVAGNNISCASVPVCQSPPYVHLKSNKDMWLCAYTVNKLPSSLV